MQLLALSLLLSSTGAPAATAASPESPLDDESAEIVAEILASDALVDELGPIDEGPWLLHDVLQRGFAQSPTPERAVRDAFGGVGFERNDSWALRLERSQLLAHLRLPTHGGREAAREIAFDIPMADHPLVDLYIDYFTGRGRWFFAKWLARADRYIPLMEPVFAAHGLPRDLVYVAMIESGFSSHAVSTARACGFWQFIGSTGRLYKLRQDVWMDDRRDFIRATEAAANYLGTLYKEFGDWYLAWAGYNAGEGRIRRAIARYGTRDFWQLVSERGALAKETQHYVPKVLAAAIVARDRKKYGFDDVAPEPPLAWDEITVEDATELGAIAKKFGFDLGALRELNPALVYGVTPPGHGGRLRVPAGRGAEVATWLSGLPREQRLSYARHVVARGESLSVIARQHGSTIDAIREFNHIANVKRLRPGQALIIPVAARGAGRSVVASQPAPSRTGASARPAVERSAASRPALSGSPEVASAPTKSKPLSSHKVAAGETLWSIAQRYGVSVDQVKSWNGRRGNKVGVGEVLRIHTPKT